MLTKPVWRTKEVYLAEVYVQEWKVTWERPPCKWAGHPGTQATAKCKSWTWKMGWQVITSQSAAKAHSGILARIGEKNRRSFLFSPKHVFEAHKSAFWDKRQRTRQSWTPNCLLWISTWMSGRLLKLKTSKTVLRDRLHQTYWFLSVPCLNESHQLGFPKHFYHLYSFYYKTVFPQLFCSFLLAPILCRPCGETRLWKSLPLGYCNFPDVISLPTLLRAFKSRSALDLLYRITYRVSFDHG